MNRENRKKLYAAAGLLTAFVLWTAAVCLVDVQPIGPEGSAVGFAALNGWFHRLTGVHLALYTATDLLSLIPAACVAAFGVLGLWQWVRRKSLRKVDRSILVLGGFYAAVLTAFVGFEKLALNFRPILIEGRLEASYPSSTTLLVLCVMPTAALQIKERVANAVYRRWAVGVIAAFSAFMVIARLISGVHWLTDIIGGGLLSAGLVLLYAAFSRKGDEASPQ